MGRQVRFRATDADRRVLEGHLREIGAAFVPWMASTPEAVTQPSLDPPPGWATYPWIVRREDLPCLTRYRVESQGYWLIDEDPCPLVDWRFGGTDGDPGRVHFDTRVRVGGQWVDAPEDFLAWADGILRWVRRAFVYDPAEKVYYGPEAARMVGLESKRTQTPNRRP